MDKVVMLLLCASLLVVAGCASSKNGPAVVSQPQDLQAQNKALSNQVNGLEKQIRDKDAQIAELNDRINKLEHDTSTAPTVYSCTQDKDCTLVVAGCPSCPSCQSYNLTDPEIMAVNKNIYKCPTFEGVCVACVSTFTFDLSNDARCKEGRCIKGARQGPP